MIVLNLLCDNGHCFEGWFASSVAFRDQLVRKLVQCAYCQTSSVTQLPSGPHIRRGVDDAAMGRSPADPAAEPIAQPVHAVQPEAAQKLFQALTTMARQAENVGERLPEEARRIHYKEAPARNIRGVATLEETHELLDEGILVLPALIPPESETH